MTIDEGAGMRESESTPCQQKGPSRLRPAVTFLTILLAVVFGVLVAEPASAVLVTYTYDVATYTYDAPALPSSPDTVATGVRSSPEWPEATSWASHASALDHVVAANTGCADFIASADGVVLPTSRSRLVAGFEEAGLPSTPTTSAGSQYTLPEWFAGAGDGTFWSSRTARVVHEREWWSHQSVHGQAGSAPARSVQV